MDLGGVCFFAFLAAVILVPQLLRHQERARLHETLRIAYERGQPVPPELIAALQSRRNVYYNAVPSEVVAGWRPRQSEAPPPPPADGGPAPFVQAPILSPAASSPLFVSQAGQDMRRGLIWLAVGLGLIAAGAASYAGLYYVGGAQETFSMFAAFGAIPAFVGATYLALAWFARGKTKA